jgi:hypothetical protein
MNINKGQKMEIKGTFATAPKNLSVLVDPWMVESAVETMFEMGALAVTVHHELGGTSILSK